MPSIGQRPRIRSRATPASALLLAVALAAPGGCREATPGASSDAPPDAAASARAPGSAPSAALGPPPAALPSGNAAAATAQSAEGADVLPAEGCAPVDPAERHVQLLRLRLTSGIDRKNPVDKLYAARPGQRIWAHLAVRNRSGRERCVLVRFKVGGEPRTEIGLEVGHSWGWRTWAYVTLRPSDRSGPLEVEVVDDQGRLLVKERLAIVAAASR
ncbi:MAG: DUF2914 domain-containing protein [Deltaproteobacteria bacterium]|nr:DUF2914 domain-containing protein [Deltaproteobacteria bacterium]